jgi:hypothetical protein
MYIKSDYAYPSWLKWMRIMELTPDQVKVFLPEFDGHNMINKSVVVLKTRDMSYREWECRRNTSETVLCEPPLVSGIVGIECHDGSYYLVKAR